MASALCPGRDRRVVQGRGGGRAGDGSFFPVCGTGMPDTGGEVARRGVLRFALSRCIVLGRVDIQTCGAVIIAWICRMGQMEQTLTVIGST